jgi:hypothetical protein
VIESAGINSANRIISLFNPFTFQVMIELVPPAAEPKNCVVVTTFTEIVAGEMVTEIFVVGSMHETDEEALEVVAAVVVHVTAVLVEAALLQEAKPNRPAINANRKIRFTAPRFSSAVVSISGIPCSWRSIANCLPNTRNHNFVPFVATPLGRPLPWADDNSERHLIRIAGRASRWLRLRGSNWRPSQKIVSD